MYTEEFIEATEKELKGLDPKAAKNILLFTWGYMSETRLDGLVAFQEGLTTAISLYGKRKGK